MLTKLKVAQFRCFEAHEISLAPGINLIVGPNARGKTSLLEAACVLLRLQSPRTSRLAEIIRHGQRGLLADGIVGLHTWSALGQKPVAKSTPPTNKPRNASV